MGEVEVGLLPPLFSMAFCVSASKEINSADDGQVRLCEEQGCGSRPYLVP